MKFILALIGLIATVFAERPEIVECKGQVNESPLINVNFKLTKQSTHGKRYDFAQGDNVITLLQVRGTPYQMGYAQGQLYPEKISENMDNMKDYLTGQVTETLIDLGFPKFIANLFTPIGYQIFDFLLGLNYFVAEPFIPDRYVQEMKGMSDASGIPYVTIRNMNMLPELIKAACTIAGAWSVATVDEKLLTVRALDWDYHAPLNKNPSVVVYHVNEGDGFNFANVGWAGVVGSITAIGSQGVSISEKVWLPRDPENYPTTYYGKPWTFVLRDLAQYETTLEQMYGTIENTDRTCRIHMGLGSTADNAFEAINYSWKVFEFFNDKNYTHYEPVSHPQMDGVVFFDKHVQPSGFACTGSILNHYHGEITRENLYRNMCGQAQTGDAQICVTDLHEMNIWLSYSSYETPQNPSVPAYDRSPMFINLKGFFDKF